MAQYIEDDKERLINTDYLETILYDTYTDTDKEVTYYRITFKYTNGQEYRETYTDETTALNRYNNLITTLTTKSGGDVTRAYVDEENSKDVRSIDFNPLTFTIIFTSHDGTTKEIDLPIEDMESDIDELKTKISEIELVKFPNVTIYGSPIINQGQVSNFSTSNYLKFPFIVDFKGRPFTINFQIETNDDVVTQQNFIDSEYGLAVAISNSNFVVAMSSDGTSWDIGNKTGTYTVLPNTTYYIRLTWDTTTYKLEYSLDKEEYITDIEITSSSSLYPKSIYIGGVDTLFGTAGHPFFGIINMNNCNLVIQGLEVWQGMDDVGLATRADISLSNLDEEGVNKIKSSVKLLIDDNGYIYLG